MHATEGMWWKPEAGVTGFVALSNVTSESINARVQVSDNANNVLGTYTAPQNDTTFIFNCLVLDLNKIIGQQQTPVPVPAY